MSPGEEPTSRDDGNHLLHRMREEAKNTLPQAGNYGEEPPVDHRKMRYPPGMVEFDEDLDGAER